MNTKFDIGQRVVEIQVVGPPDIVPGSGGTITNIEVSAYGTNYTVESPSGRGHREVIAEWRLELAPVPRLPTYKIRPTTSAERCFAVDVTTNHKSGDTIAWFNNEVDAKKFCFEKNQTAKETALESPL